jgi:hypothetical protein
MPAEISEQLPKSFPMDSFDIEARALGNPTKDHWGPEHDYGDNCRRSSS